MWEKITSWMRGVWSKMTGQADIKKALGVEPAISGKMQRAIEEWDAHFKGEPDYLDENTATMNLASAIAGEIARLVTVELKSEVTGGPRAKFLQEMYAKVLEALRVEVEYAAAGGGVVFKPYVQNGKTIAVDFVHAGRFIPTACIGKMVTGGVFIAQATRGKAIYTRLEYHNLQADGYLVRNVVYRSESAKDLGVISSLDAVDEWRDLEEEQLIQYEGGQPLERPLFAYVATPFANHIDEHSPLGVSVYSRAVGLLKEADRQYSRILWEYEGSELAIDAAPGALRPRDPGARPGIWGKGPAADEEREGVSAKRRAGQPVLTLPKRKQRLFRGLNIDRGEGKELYEVFSPEIRDVSLFNGLDNFLKRIEFASYLSYGTISDPQSVEKTAEEIKMSKQRSYSAVRDIQKAFQNGLEHLVWAMDIYASLYELAPAGTYQVGFAWGDAILADAEKERAIDRMDVQDGFMQPWEYRMKWYGESEKAAKAMVNGGEEPKTDEEWMGLE